MTDRAKGFTEENATLTFAADTLEHHFSMLARKLSVTLQMTMDVLPGPDYSYRVRDGKAQFTGSTAGNVLLAVYDYLRAIGFVFLYPGQGGTYVPDIRRPEDLEAEKLNFTAAYAHRGVCLEGADSLENVLDFIDWLPKNGFNAFFLQFKKPDIFFERWYSHENNPTLVPERLERRDLDAMDRAVYRAMALRGIVCHRVGHGWTAGVLGGAGTGWHVSGSAISPDLAPLAALVEGKRDFWKGVPANTNLCYANPRARELLTNQVVDYAREHPEADYLHFWLADEYNNVCTCEECRKTTISDQYVEILNLLDEKLTQAGLGTKIVFLLYQELLYAPKKAAIRHPERFCLMFAPISRTFERSYPVDFRPVEVAPYVRNKMRMPETVEENLSHLKAWQQIFTGDGFFYDYPLGRAHYGDLGYMKIARVIYDDIHALKTFGVNGYMSCQELRAMSPTGFPDYVMAQALTDVSIPFETLRDTYFSAMFGPGWEQAVAFLEKLSALSDTDYWNNHGPRCQHALAERYRQAARLAEEFKEQIPLASKEIWRENWEYLDFHCQYTALLAGALEQLCMGEQEKADRRFADFCDYIRHEEQRRQSRLDVYRVIEVATKYTGFSMPQKTS